MTLILTQADWDELQEQAPIPQFDNLKLDDAEEITGVPAALGQGYVRSIQLLPGVWLNFDDYKYRQDLLVKAPAHDHDIQLAIHLSGFIYFDAVHPNLGGSCGYFSGSGMSPAYVEKYRAGERLTIVNVDIDPNWLISFLQDEQYNSDAFKQLFRGEEWKTAFYPTVTPAMRSIARQLWNAPYRGAAKRMYLQAKVLELLAMHLDLIADASPPLPNVSGLKPETIAALHQVKAILTAELEHPPSIVELAQQVGLSDRTLQRGFRALFGTTIVGYSMQQRLNYAEHLIEPLWKWRVWLDMDIWDILRPSSSDGLELCPVSVWLGKSRFCDHQKAVLPLDAALATSLHCASFLLGIITNKFGVRRFHEGWSIFSGESVGCGVGAERCCQCCWIVACLGTDH